jgi:hypothetical protein
VNKKTLIISRCAVCGKKNQPDHLKVNDLVNFRTKRVLKVTIYWDGTPLVSFRYAQVLQTNLLPTFCTLQKESILLGYDAASLGEHFPNISEHNNYFIPKGLDTY